MAQGADRTDGGIDAHIARIEAMRNAGTVTAEEAERLIAVLHEIEGAGADIDAIDHAPMPPVPAPPPSALHAPPTPPEASAAPSPATQWITISILAGDVRVRGGDVDEPTLTSDDEHVSLRRDGAGWTLRDTPRFTFLSFVQRGTDVDLTIPRGMGVVLDVKAGDVRLSDVIAVSGKMMAGDLSIDGAEAIDVQKSAGDLDARVRLTRGRHRIRASAGDVDVTLLAGSDVAIDASVTMGDVRAGPGFERSDTMTGGTLAGSVGAGTASLEVRLSAGDVRVQVEGGNARG
ncbi:MAG: DUF4097 family beta strand repeat protein [Trueperaceae bacterium]|nr:DUF4097 family beta strand repeat protein [Trueperaceae bacterium]